MRAWLTHPPLLAPGVFDGISARLVQDAGFRAAYISGGALARSAGYPDIGLLSFGEILARISAIREATTLPLIADADTGYGNVLHVARTVRLYERAGVQALHIEDQSFPKRCGHLNGKHLIKTAAMVDKIRAACDARINPAMKIIARTDAIAVEGLERALERAHYYAQAGADMLFVEAPETIEQIETIARILPYPKVLNVFQGGKTPLVERKILQRLKFDLIIVPSDLQRAALFAMRQALEHLKEHGHTGGMQDRMMSFQERELLVRTTEYLTRVEQAARE